MLTGDHEDRSSPAELNQIAESADKSCEGPVAESRQFSESALRQDSEAGPAPRQWPGSYAAVVDVDEGRYCAYNQTRERFLSNSVEVADFSPLTLETRLATLQTGSGAALWIVPFRGLAPTSLRFPVDLVYLQHDCVVLEAVESFPIALASSSISPAATVLVLPAHTIASAEIHPGDQLLLCPPAEMKSRLRQLQSESTARQQSFSSQSQGSALHPHPFAPATGGDVREWDDSARNEPMQDAPAFTAPLSPAPVSQPASAVQKPAKPIKKWWQRLLSNEPPEPPDPRGAQREPLPGLVAYFFTGSTPTAHGVRDISSSGMYVFTTERWYRGTVVRITLTDHREPTVERSITLNAKVVRWGNDGVGVQFLFPRQKHQHRGIDVAGQVPTAKQLEQFIQRFRSGLPH